MSNNSELKDVAKVALRLGLEVGMPVAKKVLSSETGQTLVMLAADMTQDILSSVLEKTKEEMTTKRALYEANIAAQAEEVRKMTEKLNTPISDEVIEKIKKEHPDMYKELIKTPTPKR